MITADTQKMTQAAREIGRRADTIEAEGLQLEQLLRKQREGKKVLFFFKQSTADIEALARQRAAVVEGLRNQSLYLLECAKRYKNVQSLAAVRAERIK